MEKAEDYTGVLSMVSSGSCVAFIGSGVSKPKYPGWDELVVRLCSECGLGRVGLDPDGDVSALLTAADRARIADEGAYRRTLDDIFGHPPAIVRRAYDLLMRIGFSAYVTTNFDQFLAMETQKPEHKSGGVYKFPDLPLTKIDTRAAFYLHGLVEGNWNLDDVILGKRDFDREYINEYGTLRSFLQQLVTYSPLLFVGCRLREQPVREIFEACRRVRERIRERGHGTPPARYALLPRRSRLNSVHRSMERDRDAEDEEATRFDELDIKVVRYDPLDEDHSGLEKILADWCRLAPIRFRTGFEEGQLNA